MSVEKAITKINKRIDDLILSGLDTKVKKNKFKELSKLHKTLTTEYKVLKPIFTIRKIK